MNITSSATGLRHCDIKVDGEIICKVNNDIIAIKIIILIVGNISIHCITDTKYITCKMHETGPESTSEN